MSKTRRCYAPGLRRSDGRLAEAWTLAGRSWRREFQRTVQLDVKLGGAGRKAMPAAAMGARRRRSVKPNRLRRENGQLELSGKTSKGGGWFASGRRTRSARRLPHAERLLSRSDPQEGHAAKR